MKEPGQFLWQSLWGGLSYSWKGATSEARETYAAVEAAIRADERAKVVEECARIARGCFWSNVGGGRIVSRQASPDEVEAAIRAISPSPAGRVMQKCDDCDGMPKCFCEVTAP